MMSNAVVGIGEILWDLLPDGKKLGGAPANFAYHVSQFGLPGCVVSAVGNDPLGREITSMLDEKKVNRHIETVDFPTGTVEVDVDSDGIPSYNIKEGVAWDNIRWNDTLADLARNTKAVCFGSLAQRHDVSRDAIHRFVDSIPAENNPLIVFDINLRQDFFTKEILDSSMRRCNILKINDEELVTVSRLFGIPGPDMREISEELLRRYNLSILILTCGINGSYVFTPGESSFLPTPKVTVADTVGAGDSFTAAFTASILKGLTVKEAHRRAVDTSAFVCSQFGAMPLLPTNLTH